MKNENKNSVILLQTKITNIENPDNIFSLSKKETSNNYHDLQFDHKIHPKEKKVC